MEENTDECSPAALMKSYLGPNHVKHGNTRIATPEPMAWQSASIIYGRKIGHMLVRRHQETLGIFYFCE